MINNNKFKIRFLTFGDSYNYGASLQMYATYVLLKNYGDDVKLINYRNKNEKKKYSKFSINKNLSFTSNFKNILKNSIFRGNKNGEKAFKNFNTLIPRTVFYNRRNIISFDNIENTDVVVIGSDQVWNPGIFGGKLDPCFFGTFTRKKIVTLSSSCGSYLFNKEDINNISIWLNRIYKISVREKFLKEQMEKFSDKKVDVLLDPTLLINKSNWNSIISNKESKLVEITEKYVFVYLISVKYENCIDYIRWMGLKGYKIVYVNLYKIKKQYVDYYIFDATPYDFIRLLGNANFILTDSFHGVAFSINYNKNFVVVPNHNSKRLENILEDFCIEDRLVNNMNEWKNVIDKQINYDKVNILLENKREEARSFLDDAFNK